MKNLLLILVSLVWVLPTLADDDFDPTPPAEPYTKYKVVTSATPYGYTSGSGTYVAGTEVRISTSAYNANYSFLYWTKDGEEYSAEQSFTYTMEDKAVKFVAVYEYSPADPEDPSTTNDYRLYLTNNYTQAGSFNRTSGGKVEAGTTISLSAYANQNYDFVGWYNGSELVSEEATFQYTMPECNTTLTAMYEYNPVDPDDPGYDEEKNYLLGDVNDDEVVDLTDVSEMTNYLLGISTLYTFNTTAADVNKDDHITISDLTEIIALIKK